jgi:hypothetical protein
MDSLFAANTNGIDRGQIRRSAGLQDILSHHDEGDAES